MSRPAHTRRTILERAEALIQEQGFNGFSYAHIAADLGVKNAAIHYHFPTKEDLGCAVVGRYRERFRLWTGNARLRGRSPAEKLEWFLGIYTRTRADHGKVCLVGSLEAEFQSLPEALREQARALNRELLDWLAAVLQEGRQAGAFRFEGEPADKAALVLTSLQGGLQMARALGAARFQALVGQIRRELLA